MTKTVGNVTHTYYYAGGKLLRETYGSNTLDFFYNADGSPYAFKYNGTPYYYITNLQGDVMRIVDSDAVCVGVYRYDPYGNLVSSSGDMVSVNPLRYRGYYYDSETGFYYLQSRYYDPELGRFLNADDFASTGQGILGHNMFAYCGNNPSNCVDHTGSMPKSHAMVRQGGVDAAIVLHEGQAVSVTMYNGTINIDVYMTFSGDIDPEFLLRGMKEYWEGAYNLGDSEIELILNVYQGKSSLGQTISVNTSNSYGRSYCTTSSIRWKRTKQSTITLYTEYYETIGCDWTVAHELGHSLGVGDYYTQLNKPGYYENFSSIMNLPGHHACAQDVFMVLYALAFNTWSEWMLYGGN